MLSIASMIFGVAAIVVSELLAGWRLRKNVTQPVSVMFGEGSNDRISQVVFLVGVALTAGGIVLWC